MFSHCRLTSHSCNVSCKRMRLTSPRLTTRHFGGRQQTADSQSSTKRSHETGSLWSEDSWDQVFLDLDKSLPPTRPSAPLFSKPRRQTMTERESKVLTGMLDMIFESKEAREDHTSNRSSDHSNVASGGIIRGQVDDLFSRLRRFSRRPRKEVDSSAQLFDKKKEEMSFCTTDRQLLEWALREVFAESQKYEEAARKAMTEASTIEAKAELPLLQSPIYSQLIAHLMRTFRVHFRDPNLALFIFSHAQNLSTVSYVFGCSTAAYNELIETLWLAFSDLEGVLAAIQEMDVNGVPFDSRTRKVIDTIRRELGSKEILTGSGEDVQSENWETLAKIEKLLAPKLQTKRKSFVQWKAEVDIDENETFDNWSFGDLERFSTAGRSAQSRAQRSRESRA